MAYESRNGFLAKQVVDEGLPGLGGGAIGNEFINKKEPSPLAQILSFFVVLYRLYPLLYTPNYCMCSDFSLPAELLGDCAFVGAMDDASYLYLYPVYRVFNL